MNPSTKRLHSALFGSLLSLGAFVAGCGDDEVTGQGGGGGGTSTTAATTAASATASTTASTTSTVSATTSGTAGGGGDGGEGGTDPGTGGAGGEGGEGGEGGGEPCPEQPDPYAIGDDTEDACADLAGDPAAPAFHVEFIGEPSGTMDYDGTVALDYAFPYVLALPLEQLGDFTVTESRCQSLAGDDVETCSSGEVDLSQVDASCSMRSSGRWGLDPGNVREGLNTFDFTMTLRHGCAEVSDTFTIVVDYQPVE